jgi:hypothetical protein
MRVLSRVLSSFAIVGASAVVVVALSSPPAAATVVVVPSLEELTHRSDVIVHAIVRDVVTITDERGRLITETSLEVIDGLRGAKAGDVVPVHQVGGSLGAKRAWIAGNHRFHVGEEVVFFGVHLPKDPRVVIPYGIGFGIFDVTEDVDGRHAVELGSDDVVQVVKSKKGAPQMVPVTPRHFDNVDTFKQQLRSILAGSNAPPLRYKQLLRPELRAPAVPPSSSAASVKGE